MDPRAPLTPDLVEPLIAPRGPLALAAVVPDEPSTNTALAAALRQNPDAWPHLSAYVADHQTAGRGRSGRVWETPRGVALTASFVLRPRASGPDLAWAPLVVGLAAVRAVRALGVDAALKWPNDVIVDVAGADDIAGWGTWRKVVGILCEIVDGAVVAGVGVNVAQGAHELPVPHAASLASLGMEVTRVAVLDRLASEIAAACRLWDADPEAIRAEVTDVCATLGLPVAVDAGGPSPVVGTATGLGGDGALLVTTASGVITAVLAGDVRVRRAR
ncbi:biotin--[acetyl-CoA-carboxylase] ligase [Demequina sp. NBRC 110052]|uniref:biotin--[acetyl-CoA-carboxylase] ligase n=1 Tax=Demequina sp. NBRC 110052 TaxID=1570341 RepID=UPI000A009FE9|nr:biotin--[acetyl-CoA-carboxylase] ligase [Demequina sp. NBRC 110052]